MMNIRWAVIVFMVLMLSVDDVSAWKNKRLKNIIYDTNNWQISGHSGVTKTIKETVLDKLSKVKSKKDFYKLFNIPMTMSRDITNVGLTGNPGGPAGVYGNHRNTFVRSLTSEPNGPAGAHGSRNSLAKKSDKQPECEPKLGLYTIPNIDGMLMIPRCLHNVRRCGGCCTDEWKECVVVNKTIKSVNVSIFKRSDPVKTFRNHTVYYTDHDTCTCQCQLRPSDCTPNQWHDGRSCECKCKNTKIKCSSLKMWSKARCMCVCKDIECTNGMKRDDTTCLCTQ